MAVQKNPATQNVEVTSAVYLVKGVTAQEGEGAQRRAVPAQPRPHSAPAESSLPLPPSAASLRRRRRRLVALPAEEAGQPQLLLRVRRPAAVHGNGVVPRGAVRMVTRYLRAGRGAARTRGQGRQVSPGAAVAGEEHRRGPGPVASRRSSCGYRPADAGHGAGWESPRPPGRPEMAKGVQAGFFLAPAGGGCITPSVPHTPSITPPRRLPQCRVVTPSHTSTQPALGLDQAAATPMP